MGKSLCYFEQLGGMLKIMMFVLKKMDVGNAHLQALLFLLRPKLWGLFFNIRNSHHRSNINIRAVLIKRLLSQSVCLNGGKYASNRLSRSMHKHNYTRPFRHGFVITIQKVSQSTFLKGKKQNYKFRDNLLISGLQAMEISGKFKNIRLFKTIWSSMV